jgi:hypothetical protein
MFVGSLRIGGVENAALFCRSTLERSAWTLGHVLTGGGSDFKGGFAKAYGGLGVRKSRTKSRDPLTNGFVERVQGMGLHEHRHVGFRRRSFTGVGQLERSPTIALRLDDCDRPHRGDRSRGRTSGSIL